MSGGEADAPILRAEITELRDQLVEGRKAAAAEVTQLKDELRMIKSELDVRVTVIKQEVVNEVSRAGRDMVDSIEMRIADVRIQLDRTNADCATLQSQIREWTDNLAELLRASESEVATKMGGIDSDLLHQNSKTEGVIAQVRKALDEVAQKVWEVESRVGAAEQQLQGKGALGATQGDVVLRDLA